LSTNINIKSEFAHELVLAVPYAYWLQLHGKLSGVTTSKDMKPFYYFCDNVIEKYTHRTMDHKTSGLVDSPNTWIHHNSEKLTGKSLDELSTEEQTEVNGVLDYSQWTPPPYAKHYQTDEFNHLKPYIVVNSNYNVEYGNDITESLRYFDIKILYEIFNYLTNKGYHVIYKRPDNTEFILDQNEMMTRSGNFKLTANVQGAGVISDYDLCNYYDKVINLNLLKNDYTYSYNELQMKLFSGADGFISTNGGGGILCGYFDAPVVMHIPHGKELRTNYLTNENSYYNKLSYNKLYAVIDPNNQSNYTKVMNKIKEVYRGENK
jgi:hypothetical protein